MHHYLRRPNRAILLGLILLGGRAALAQAPAWQTAIAPAGTGTSSITATAPAAAGGVYVAGFFSGTLQLGGLALTSAGGKDAFVALYQPGTRSFGWALALGGATDDAATALAVQGGSLCVAGNFRSPGAAVAGTTLTNADPSGNTDDVFVLSLNDLGSSAALRWAVRAGGPAEELAAALVPVAGGVAVAGSFASARAQFGATTLAKNGVGNGHDVFVAKFLNNPTAASVAWAVAAGGPEDDLGTALAANGTSLYVAGSYADVAHFGAAALTVPPGDGDDAFVARLTDGGSSASFGWVQPITGPGFEVARTLAVAGNRVYVAGETAGPTVRIGSNTFTNADPSATNTDVFVACLADAGASSTYAWAVPISGRSTELAGALLAAGGAVYLTGSFYGANTTFGPHTLNTAGYDDVYLTKLLDGGTAATFAWAQTAGDTGHEFGQALCRVGNTFYVGGAFTSASLNFGPQTINSAAGRAAGFLATLADPLLAARPAAGPAATSPYPNPAHDWLTVELAPDWAATSLAVTDNLGRPVQTLRLPAGAALGRVNLQGLAAGCYVLRIGTAGGVVVRRFGVE